MPLTYSTSSNNVNLYLQIKNSEGKAVPYIFVWLMEKGTETEIKGVADSKGKASFTVISGKNYIVHFKDSEQHMEIVIPQRGMSFITKTVIYDGTQEPDVGQVDKVPTREGKNMIMILGSKH